MEEEKKKNKRIVFSIIAVLLLVAVVAGVTYAYFSATANTNTQTVTTANMELAFNDGTAIVNASNITPISQADIQTKAAKKSFSVTNNGTDDIYLQMKLTDITIPTELKSVWFRFALFEEGTRIALGEFSNTTTERFMQQNMTLAQGKTKNYDLYIWIEESGEDQNTMQGKTFSGKVTVNGSMTSYADIVKTIPGDVCYDRETGQYDAASFLISYDSMTTSMNIDGNCDFTYSTYLEEFTNVRTLSYGPYMTSIVDVLPISIEKLTLNDNNAYIDLRYLTNLQDISIESHFIDEDEVKSNKLPLSLITLSGYTSYQSSYDDGTYDFTNLVNLKTIKSNVLPGLGNTSTVKLPLSIQNAVTIESGAFGSATIIYE